MRFYHLRFASLLEGSIQHQTGTAHFHSLCGWCGPWACQVARHSAPNQSPQAKHWPLNKPKTSFSKGSRCQVPTQKVRDLESPTPDLLQNEEERRKKLFIPILLTWKTFGRWLKAKHFEVVICKRNQRKALQYLLLRLTFGQLSIDTVDQGGKRCKTNMTE